MQLKTTKNKTFGANNETVRERRRESSLGEDTPRCLRARMSRKAGKAVISPRPLGLGDKGLCTPMTFPCLSEGDAFAFPGYRVCL